MLSGFQNCGISNERIDGRTHASSRSRSPRTGPASAAATGAAPDRSHFIGRPWFMTRFPHDGRTLPRGALVVYREYYGMQPGKPNVGLRLPAEEVAREIVRRETAPSTGRRESVAFGVLDPAAFAVISGPSIAETLPASWCRFPAGRQQPRLNPEEDGRLVGTALAKGDEDGNPMLFLFSTCGELIRTLPMMLHDPTHPEDLDTDLEGPCGRQLPLPCHEPPIPHAGTASRIRQCAFALARRECIQVQ